jgi:hypothetical protein
MPEIWDRLGLAASTQILSESNRRRPESGSTILPRLTNPFGFDKAGSPVI